MRSITFIILLLVSLNTKAYCQPESTEKHSMWGKLWLAQNSPDPVYVGDMTTVEYKAYDALNVSIRLFDEEGECIHVYDDLYPGHGKINIRKSLPPGKYTYALMVNGRLVQKKTMEVMNK